MQLASALPCGRSHRYPSPVPRLDDGLTVAGVPVCISTNGLTVARGPFSHLDERSNRCREVVSDARQRLHRCVEYKVVKGMTIERGLSSVLLSRLVT